MEFKYECTPNIEEAQEDSNLQGISDTPIDFHAAKERCMLPP